MTPPNLVGAGRVRRASASIASWCRSSRGHSRSQMPEADRRRPGAQCRRRTGPAKRTRQAQPGGARRRPRSRRPSPSRASRTVTREELPLEILYPGRRRRRDEQAGRHGGAPRARATPRARWSTRCSTTSTDLSGIGGELRPGIVHRLDRGTSGVMVVAKHDAAHQELARQFHDREVEKEYIALVWGVVQAGRRIDAAIGRDPGDRQKMSTRAKHAREAVTRITRAMHLPGADAVPGGDPHRPHAPDPRAPQRDRPPDRRRLDLRRRPPARRRRHPGGTAAGTPVPPRRPARVHPPARRRRIEFMAPLPADLQAVLDDLPGWPPEEKS